MTLRNALLCAWLTLGLMGCSSIPTPSDPSGNPPPPAGNEGVPQLKRVMVIILENVDYAKAIQQPYLASLIAKGALLSNYYGLARPSQPNYIGLVAGDTFKIATNNNVDLDATHIGDLLENKGLTWKVYAEGYPESGCFTGSSKGQYFRKHNPMISFNNVHAGGDRCLKIMPANRLDADILLNRLPNFSLYIPDDNDNGHDTGVVYADKWLAKNFGPRFSDKAFMDGMLVAITFDEGGIGQHIYTVLFGDPVKLGSTNDVSLNHYNLLRTIEDGFGLGTLGRNDAKAAPIFGVWK